jgi:hypothetical protein
MVCPGFPSVGCQSSHFPDLLPLNTTPLLDKQLVLKLQPNQLITITRLDINLTHKNKPFTTRLILLSSPRHRFGLFILLPPKHKVDTIRTPEMHVYNHLDPMAQSGGSPDMGVVATTTSGGAAPAGWPVVECGGSTRCTPTCDPCLLPVGWLLFRATQGREEGFR